MYYRQIYKLHYEMKLDDFMEKFITSETEDDLGELIENFRGSDNSELEIPLDINEEGVEEFFEEMTKQYLFQLIFVVIANYGSKLEVLLPSIGIAKESLGRMEVNREDSKNPTVTIPFIVEYTYKARSKVEVDRINKDIIKSILTTLKKLHNFKLVRQVILQLGEESMQEEFNRSESPDIQGLKMLVNL